MIEIALMIEGQNGLNWPRWQRIVSAAEDLGFKGIYRSDHYTNATPPDKDSLELWVSLTWLAANSRSIEFGPLVSPVSFRHPTMTARMAAAVDDLSAGRLVLGLGAGWQAREHTNYGWQLLDPVARMNRFEEALQIITQLFGADQPVTFQGDYYQVKDAVLLPRPGTQGGPPILIGGNGPRRTLPLAAQYASEWNGVFVSSGDYLKLNQRLDELLKARGRSPGSITRSVMVGIVFASNHLELEARIARRPYGRSTIDDLRQRGVLAGTGEQILEQIRAYEAAGAQKIMIQWLDLEDLDNLALLSKTLFG